MVELFLNIKDICIDNPKMIEILGFIFEALITSQRYRVKDINGFKIYKDHEDIIQQVAKVVKYIIAYSGINKKKYFKDFQLSKLFTVHGFGEMFKKVVEEGLKEEFGITDGN